MTDNEFSVYMKAVVADDEETSETILQKWAKEAIADIDFDDEL